MIRGAMVAAAALAAVLLWNGRALADPAPAAATAGDTVPPPQSSLGVPYVPRTGFFLEGQVGLFTEFAHGFTSATIPTANVIGSPTNYSNGSLFTALQLGYDIPGLNLPTNIVRRVSVFLTAGFGKNDSDCPVTAGGQCLQWSGSGNTSLNSPADFLLIPVEIGTRIGFGDIGLENLFPYVTVGLGGAFATPALAQSGGAAGFNFSVGAGLEYDTRLPGFNFGIEALFQGALFKWSGGGTSGSLFLPYLTVYPRFQYVF